jgi:hypothetical protein
MTDAELAQFERRLARTYPAVPDLWINAVIMNAIEFIGRAGIEPKMAEVEALARQSLQMRESLG